MWLIGYTLLYDIYMYKYNLYMVIHKHTYVGVFVYKFVLNGHSFIVFSFSARVFLAFPAHS